MDNGGDALDYLRNGSYDAAILDVMMPVMDGVTVLRRIREESINTPVLVLTAKAEIEDKITGLDAGVNDYLTKPFDIRELLARLRVLTRRTGIQYDNILSMSGSVRATADNVTALASMKIWAIVSSADTVIDPALTQAFVRSLRTRGSDVELTMLEGVDHAAVPATVLLDPDLDLIGWLVSGGK